MIVLPSLSGRQANGLRHSSRGHRPRNMTSINRSCPVRALHPLEISQRTNHVGELRVNLEPPFLRRDHPKPHYRLGQVKNIKNFLCSRGLPSLRAIRIKEPQIRKPLQCCPNLCKAPPRGEGGTDLSRPFGQTILSILSPKLRAARINPNQLFWMKYGLATGQYRPKMNQPLPPQAILDAKDTTP